MLLYVKMQDCKAHPGGWFLVIVLNPLSGQFITDGQ
jgi:hypothetical protein